MARPPTSTVWLEFISANLLALVSQQKYSSFFFEIYISISAKVQTCICRCNGAFHLSLESLGQNFGRKKPARNQCWHRLSRLGLDIGFHLRVGTSQMIDVLNSQFSMDGNGDFQPFYQPLRSGCLGYQLDTKLMVSFKHWRFLTWNQRKRPSKIEGSRKVRNTQNSFDFWCFFVPSKT